MPVELATRLRASGDRPVDATEEMRDLARRGVLAATMSAATGGALKRLNGAAYTIAMPVVFSRLTQRIELRRGHPACASGVTHLADDCMDRFEDDMEAVVDDMRRRAALPIISLEAWIASRVDKATIDGYRRRRGALGAMQRPRLPRWLSTALGDDPWLSELALNILTWTGNTATAGAEVWPTESWQRQRAAHRGDDGGNVRADITRVLDVMARRPAWFEAYVEIPLGKKQAPVARLLVGADGGPIEQSALSLVDRDAQDDAQLRVLAYQAFEAIRLRTRRGEPARVVVAEVIGALFGTAPCAEGRLAVLLRDPAELDRLVAEVLALVEEPGTLPD